MRVLVLSDTHMDRFPDESKLNFAKVEEYDAVIHAGDFDGYEFYREMRNRCNLTAVAGDSDDERIREELPGVVTLEIEGVRIGVTHKGNYLNEFHDIAYKAKELGVDVMIFGHVHRFIVEEMGGKLLICPGSPTVPRLSIGSFVELLIDEESEEREERFEVVKKIGGKNIGISAVFLPVMCCFRPDTEWRGDR